MIRTIRPQDLETMANHSVQYNPRHLRDILTHPYTRGAIVEKPGIPVAGHVIMTLFPKRVCIEDIAVNPCCQRQRIGTLLLIWAEVITFPRSLMTTTIPLGFRGAVYFFQSNQWSLEILSDTHFRKEFP